MLNLKTPEETKILVIGDVMIDHYIIGEVTRISPEAPVPVVDVKCEYYTLGGAGNVINNLAVIGAQVYCIGVVGNDEYADQIKKILNTCTVSTQIFTDNSRKTIHKTRIIADGNSQLLRIDKGDTKPFVLDDNIELNIPDDIDIIIVSDYNKGMITGDIMNRLKLSKKKIIVDPKPEHYALYDNVFMITPNRKEYYEMPKLPNSEYILKTMGKNGMILMDMATGKQDNIEGKEVQVFNVSGAGDTVVATMAICIAMGLSPDYITCARIANDAAGIVVTKPGTSVIIRSEFDEIVKKYIG